MRARIGFAVVAVTILAIALIAWQRPLARAQSTAPRPLLWNEISQWCGDDIVEGCDATYSDLPDGSVRVVFNTGFNNPEAMFWWGGCRPLTLPDRIDGYAYVRLPDGKRTVLSIADAAGVMPSVMYCELVVRRSQ